MQWHQQNGHSSDLNTPLQVAGGVIKNAAGSIIVGEVSFQDTALVLSCCSEGTVVLYLDSVYLVQWWQQGQFQKKKKIHKGKGNSQAASLHLS